MEAPGCPYCGSTKVAWKPKVEVWDCLECEQRFRPAERLLEIDERVLAFYPTPIAAPWKLVFDDVQSPASRLMNLFATFQQSLRLPALLMLSQYLDGDVVARNMAGAIRRLKAPSVMGWQNLIGALCRHRDELYSMESFSPELAAAMDRLRRSSVESPGRSRSLLDAIRSARNEWSHGNVLSDQMASQSLEPLLDEMRTLLRFLRPLEELHLYVLGADLGHDSFHARTTRPQRVSSDQMSPALLASVGVHELVFQNRKGSIQPLYPLLLADVGAVVRGVGWPDVLLFDGYTRRDVFYMGRSARHRRQDPYEALRHGMEAKEIDLLISAAEIWPRTLALWSHGAVEDALQHRLGDGFRSQAYVERQPIEGQLMDWLCGQGAPGALLLGGAGTGKTTLICSLATALASTASSEHDVIAMLFGEDLQAHRSVWAAIRAALGMDATVASFASFLELVRTKLREDPQNGPIRLNILCDALNEGPSLVDHLHELASMADLASRASLEPGLEIRILATVRTGPFRTLEANHQLTGTVRGLPSYNHFQSFPGPNGPTRFLAIPAFTELEASLAWARLQALLELEGEPHCAAPWSELPEHLKTLVRHPLMLKLSHRAFAGRHELPASVSEAQLWQAWLDETLRVRPDLWHWVRVVASKMLDNGSALLDAEAVNRIRDPWAVEVRRRFGDGPWALALPDPLERLESSGLLRSERDGYAVAHQRLAEILLAAEINARTDRLDPEQITPLIEKAEGFDELQGALSHLVAGAWSCGAFDRLATQAWCEHPELWSQILATALVRGARPTEFRPWFEQFVRFVDALSPVARGWIGKKTLFLVEPAFRDGTLPLQDRAELVDHCCAWVRLACGHASDRATMRSSLVWALIRQSDKKRHVRKHRVALRILEEALDIATEQHQQSPDDRDRLNTFGVVHERIGIAAQGTGDLQRALGAFLVYRTTMQTLRNEEPDRRLYLWNLAWATGFLAELLNKLGSTQRYRELRLEGLGYWTELYRQKPDHPDTVNHFCGALYFTAWMERRRGRLDDAMRHSLLALELARGLVARFPTHPTYRRRLSTALSDLASLSRIAGDLDRALVWNDEVLALRARLHQKEPAEALHALRMTYSIAEECLIRLDTFRLQGAAAAMEGVVGVRARLQAEAPTRRFMSRMRASGELVAARVFASMGQHERASMHWVECVEILRTLLEKKPDYDVARALLVSARLDQYDPVCGFITPASIPPAALSDLEALVERHLGHAPDDHSRRILAARYHTVRSDHAMSAHRWGVAYEANRAALRLLAGMVHAGTEQLEHEALFARCLLQRACIPLDGRLAEHVALSGIERFQKLRERSPANLRMQLTAISALHQLGRTARGQNRHSLASWALRTMGAWITMLSTREPHNPCLSNKLRALMQRH